MEHENNRKTSTFAQY